MKLVLVSDKARLQESPGRTYTLPAKAGYEGGTAKNTALVRVKNRILLFSEPLQLVLVLAHTSRVSAEAVCMNQLNVYGIFQDRLRGDCFGALTLVYKI